LEIPPPHSELAETGRAILLPNTPESNRSIRGIDTISFIRHVMLHRKDCEPISNTYQANTFATSTFGGFDHDPILIPNTTSYI
jgi:hypothetical protein